MRRQAHLDILRITASYAVVLLHTVSKKIGAGGVFFVYDGLVRWAVPMFVMISGALLLDPNKEITIAGLWKKNILKMILSLWIWSVLYCIWEFFINHRDLNYVAKTMVTGYWHMWYIFMIIALYIMTPVFRIIVKERQILVYCLAVFFVFSFFLPTVRTMIQYSKFAENPAIREIVNHYDITDWRLVFWYIPYFFMGYYLNTTDTLEKYQFAVFTLAVIGFIWNIYDNFTLTYQNGALIKEFYDALRLPVLFQSVGLFVLVKHLARRLESVILSELVQYTFGVYLIHLLFREVLDSFFGLNAQTYSFALWAPLLALLIYSLSMLGTAVINQISRLGKKSQ